MAEELGTAAMLRRPAFWLYYLWAVLLSAAGLALVSQSTSIAREIGRTVSPGGITTAVGMISLANAAGRVVLGGLFDRLGRSRTMQLVGGIFLLTGLVLIGALKLGSFPLLIAGFLLGGMAYGGVTPANAAFVSSYYGMRHYAVNLSVVVTNLLFASFGSTIAGALYDATGSYLSTDAMILVLAVLSAAVSFGIDLCDRRMLKKRGRYAIAGAGHALPVREAAKAVPIRRCAPFPQPHHPDVSLRGAKQRGTLSAKREEVPLGCNLGEAVAESSCVIRPGTARLHGPFAAVQ